MMRQGWDQIEGNKVERGRFNVDALFYTCKGRKD
jgi:hypothetical protein